MPTKTTATTPSGPLHDSIPLVSPGKKKRVVGSGSPATKGSRSGTSDYADGAEGLDDEGRRMLEGALSVVDSDGLIDAARGTARTLRECVRGGASIASLRASISAMEGDAATESFKATALALLRELEGRGGSKRPRDEPEPTGSKKYMLHRGLPTMDLFTSATELDEEDLAQLLHLEDTDVIAVEATPTAVNSTSRMRDVVSRPAPSMRSHPATTAAKPVPVALLYYDSFSSFAPSHDSTDATISYTESTTHRRSAARILEHERSESEALSLPVEDPYALPSSSSSADFVWSDEERKVLQGLEGIDPETVLRGWREESAGMDIGGELERNAQRLLLLRRAQWNKLREMKQGGEQGEEEEKEGEGAQHATAVLNSFTTLLAARPPGIVPSPAHIKALSPLVMNSLRRDPNVQGTLDDANSRAVRESMFERPTQGAMK